MAIQATHNNNAPAMTDLTSRKSQRNSANSGLGVDKVDITFGGRSSQIEYFWPIPNGVNGKINSPFATKLGRSKPHEGIDINAREGTPVLAAADGKVVYVGNDPEGYGRYVIIEHENGTRSLYAHLEMRISVQIGTRVLAGEQIGRVGRSGNASEVRNAHLHFEIRIPGARAPQELARAGWKPDGFDNRWGTPMNPKSYVYNRPYTIPEEAVAEPEVEPEPLPEFEPVEEVVVAEEVKNDPLPEEPGIYREPLRTEPEKTASERYQAGEISLTEYVQERVLEVVAAYIIIAQTVNAWVRGDEPPIEIA